MGARLFPYTRMRRSPMRGQTKNAGGLPPAFPYRIAMSNDQFSVQVPGLAEVNSALVAHSG